MSATATVMACPACGGTNDAAARFCGNCGTALGAQSAPPAPPVAKKRRSWRWWLAIGFAGLLALILLSQIAGKPFLVVLLAIVPAAFYVSLVLWVDRYEPEPRWMLAAAFLWGASGAILIAGTVNWIFGLSFGDAASASISAPIIEETAKGAVLYAVYLWRRRELDSVLDAFVYAAMVGLGFAMTENVSYYYNALREGTLADTFILRGLIRPFAHPVYATLTGIGVMLSLRSSDRRVKIGAPIVGLLSGMALHSFWNTISGVSIVLGLSVFVVVFVGAYFFVALAAKRDAAVVATYAPGVLGPAVEIAPLYSLRARIGESAGLLRSGGLKALRARDDYVRSVSERAFERYRAARDDSPQTASAGLSPHELWRLLLPPVPRACLACGQAVSKTAKFCGACGQAVASAPA